MAETVEILMKPDEVSEALRVHPVTLQRMIERGEVPAIRVGRGYRFRPTDVNSYLENHRTGKVLEASR